MKTPLNEIFSSISSLQKELNQENKQTVKERNLKKINQFLLERKKVINEEIQPQEKESTDVNFNSKFGIKNKFVKLNNRDVIELGDEIINLINNAYKRIGGHFELKSIDDLLKTDLTYWVSNDNDEDPNADVVIGGKPTNFGNKLTIIGQDGTPKSKAEVIDKMRNLLKSKGFYTEVDTNIASKIGLPPITDENIIKSVIGKPDIKVNPDGSYDRMIKGYLANKVLIGIPKYEPITPLNELFNSMSSLKEELTEQRKLTIKETNLMKIENFIKNKKNNYLK